MSKPHNDNLIRIAITEKAYAALVASVDEKPKGKPQANPSGELYVFLDQTTVARLEEIAKIYAGELSRTILRLAELRDPWDVSMLQELMSDFHDLLNDPPEWKRKVQYAEERERDFRAFVAHCLKEEPRLYERYGARLRVGGGRCHRSGLGDAGPRPLGTAPPQERRYQERVDTAEAPQLQMTSAWRPREMRP